MLGDESEMTQKPDDGAYVKVHSLKVQIMVIFLICLGTVFGRSTMGPQC